jgi:hypothetical protein
MQTCDAITKTGAPCRAPAGRGGSRCFLHSHPEKARLLGQEGGRKNRHQLPEPPSADALSAVGLRSILADAIRDVRLKKLSPRSAGAISQLANSLHRLTPTAELEDRVLRLEQQLAERSSAANPTEPETNGSAADITQDPLQETEQRVSAVAGPCQPMDIDTGTETGTDGAGDGMADEEEG